MPTDDERITSYRSRDNSVWKTVPYTDNSVSKIVFGDINGAMTFVQFKLITSRRIIRPVYKTTSNCSITTIM